MSPTNSGHRRARKVGPTKVKLCRDCGQPRLRERGWTATFTEGMGVCFICPDCQKPGDERAAEIKAAAQGYDLSPEGQIIWLPGGI